MLRFKSCLLLLVVTTNRLLALPSDTCDGHLEVSQEPTGHLDFDPSGVHRPSSAGALICTRTLDLPAGHAVLLKLLWLERGSNMSLVCTGEHALSVGDTVQLRGCDKNLARLTWAGAGHSSNAFQLFYYVQEREPSSTETHPISQPHNLNPDFASPYPETTSADEGSLTENPLDASVNSAHDTGLISPSAPPSTTVSSDREASLFPEEGPNNGPDASGASQHTDFPGRLDFFRTQHSTSERSNFSTTLEAESQSVSALDKAAGYGRASSSTESFMSSQTLRNGEIKSLASLSSEPLLEISSTKLQPNGSRIVENTDSVSIYSASHSTLTPRMQKVEWIDESGTQRDYLRTSSLSELEEHLSTTGSTATPHTTTDSGAAHNEPDLVTVTAQSTSAQVTGQTAAGSLKPSRNSKESTQEMVSTENILGGKPSSPGTSSSPSFATDLDPDRPSVSVRDSTTFRTYTTSDSVSSDSTSGESKTEEAKTSQGDVVAGLTSSSFFSGNATAGGFTGFPTQPPATSVPGEGNMMQSSDRPADGLTTLPPNTTSAQRASTFTTDISKVLPKTDSAARTTGGQTSAPSTKLHVSHVPTQASSGKYKGLNTTTETSKRGATTAATSPSLTSWTPEPVARAAITTLPYFNVENSTVHQMPKYYIVPDEPVTIRVESIELQLQIVFEESTSAWTADLEEDVALWLQPYFKRAPGFKELLGVWNQGRVVHCLVQFGTRGALQWLPRSGASSLLERAGLEQAVLEGQSIRGAKITNITLEDVQEACGWLLRCPSGFTCAFSPHTSNFSCTSVCHADHCLHHGLCTHHPAQPPVCRCVAGQDFWYMGQRCEVRMTRAQLVLSCLGVLLVVLGVVGVLACMAVRRYRALLIQAKVDQTRSSYRRFNHFDELSARFWLRSWAGSADSLDNPVFSRSDEILQLRALERPCCYHDDSLSLPSTCPSPGTHIRSIYPRSSQYAWRSSQVSVGDGVLDSGKASDLSVCSWPREPIQWSPFPLLQQLALQRPPAVRVPRTRSYCDGMELVDVNKSWTA